MKKTESKKQAKKEKGKLRTFFFSEFEKPVQARTQEEAKEKLAAMLKK